MMKRSLYFTFTMLFTFTSATALYPLKVKELIDEAPEPSPTTEPSSPKPPESKLEEDEFAGKEVTRVIGKRVPYKDPRLACLLTLIIPGAGGHFYLREDIKAISFCLGLTAGYLAGIYFFAQGLLSTSAQKSNLIIGSLSVLVGVVVHVVAMVEAYNDAVEFNEKQFYKEY